MAVIRWLRTGLPEDINQTSLVFAYTVQTLPTSVAERPPVVGQAYLFCLTVRTDGTLRAIKILSVDDPQVRDVEKALASANRH